MPRGWTCDDISAEARETCRNWFYKTACIRELLPRILIEVGARACLFCFQERTKSESLSVEGCGIYPFFGGVMFGSLR